MQRNKSQSTSGPTPRPIMLSWLTLAMILLTVIVIYLPGLHGPFVLDDGENITQNKSVALERLDAGSLYYVLTANESGPLGRPLASLSFGMNHYFAGDFDDPFHFKVTNLAIHLINTILLYVFTFLLTQAPSLKNRLNVDQKHLLSLLVTAMWALHPIQLTSVLYVVQRMNSLSAMFVLSGLIIFLKGRLALTANPRFGLRMMFAGVIGGTLLGLGAKENAVLLPLLALVIEYSLFGIGKRRTVTNRQLRWFYLLTVAGPLTLGLAYLTINPGFIDTTYLHRSFTLAERLLTETRVLWLYVSLILFPTIHRFSLFHDDMPISTGFLVPPITILALVALLGVLYFIFHKKNHYPVLFFAITWYLAGHLLESSVLGLEPAFEHRNYLPSIGILFATAFGLMNLPRLFPSTRKKMTVPLLVGVVLAFTLGFTTWSRANSWKDLVTFAESEVRHHPNSPHANDFAARASLANGDLISAIRYTANGKALAPREVGYHIDLQILLARLHILIEPDLKRLPPTSWQAGALQIDGLPECVKAMKSGDEIRVTCEDSSSTKISDLLKHRPLSVHVGLSLEELRRCLIDSPAACRSLQHDVIRWFDIAVDNPRTTPTIKERILFNAALVNAHQRNYQKALNLIERALELAPTRLSYQLGRVEYLLRLNRLDEAATRLRQATISRPPNDREAFLHEEVIQSLRRSLGE